MNNQEKKILIIGAGVSGLSAGIYALKMGYKVELYEKNATAGGECTGWDRQGYHIDNCIHWLIGTTVGTDLYDLYKTVNVINPKVGIYRADIMYTSTLNGQTIALYSDMERTRREWIMLSPEDEEQINLLFKSIKLGEKVNIPAGVPGEQLGAVAGTRLLIQSIPAFRLFNRYKNQDTQDLMNKFKHPLIRACISDFCTKETKAYSFPICYGNFVSGDGGVPKGGSRAIAYRMLDRFKELGGIYQGSSPVKKIIVENEKTTGLLLQDDKFVPADYVIAACDADFTFSHLLDPSYMNPLFKDFFSKSDIYPIYEMFQCAFAVESPEDLIRTETNLDVFSIKPEPWFNNRIAVKSYAYEPSFAPQGKQILQVMWGMDQSSWEYWKELYTNKEAYKAKKQELASLLQKKLEETWPGYKGKLTLLDSWTPCTYHRYCNAHNGYNQACVITKRSAKRPYPSAFVKGIGNLVLAGQWVSPPGGIPGSCITGKHAAYRVDYLNHKGTRICKKIFFQNVLPTLLAVFLILFLKFRT